MIMFQSQRLSNKSTSVINDSVYGEMNNIKLFVQLNKNEKIYTAQKKFNNVTLLNNQRRIG